MSYENADVFNDKKSGLIIELNHSRPLWHTLSTNMGINFSQIIKTSHIFD